eukprot:scaffold4492_cov81-Skeletonema_menzelii.AAC.4
MNGNPSAPLGGGVMALLNPAPIVACICSLLAIAIEDEQMQVDEEHLRTMIRNDNRRRRRRNLNDDVDRNISVKRRKVNWDHERAYKCVIADYFCPIARRFDDKQFERILRITPTLAEMILNRLATTDEWWTLRWDCTKKMSNAPEVKLIAALKMAAYGESFVAWQDYCQMGESTARECLSRLMKSLVEDNYFSDVYMRRMSRADARKVEELHSRKFGVRGCLGCLDVMLLPWGNCPNALKGQYCGRNKKPKIALEAACDYNLFFWHIHFGEPGSLNDINVWERSPLLHEMTHGQIQDIDFDFVINGETFHQLYWLVDGIYPRLSRFLKSIVNPTLRIDREYASWQEGKRKTIERGFGVLEKKFHITVNPIHLYFMEDIETIVLGCIVLHNMMVKVRMEDDIQESADLYQLVSQNVPNYNVRAAEAAIDQEDADFAAAPMNFRQQKDDAEMLGRQLRIVQFYWNELSDANAHLRLQNAVKRQLYYKEHGPNADVDELDLSYDPLAE